MSLVSTRGWFVRYEQWLSVCPGVYIDLIFMLPKDKISLSLI